MNCSEDIAERSGIKEKSKKNTCDKAVNWAKKIDKHRN